MAVGFRYFLKCYKKQTILLASLVMAWKYKIHLRSGMTFKPKRYTRQGISFRVQPLIILFWMLMSAVWHCIIFITVSSIGFGNIFSIFILTLIAGDFIVPQQSSLLEYCFLSSYTFLLMMDSNNISRGWWHSVNFIYLKTFLARWATVQFQNVKEYFLLWKYVLA